MDLLLRNYTRPLSNSFYQSPYGLYTSLKERYGKERAPTLKEVKAFLDKRKSHYLYTSKAANRKKIHKGESPRFIMRTSIGVLQVDVAYMSSYVFCLFGSHREEETIFQISHTIQLSPRCRGMPFPVCLGETFAHTDCEIVSKRFRGCPQKRFGSQRYS